MEINFKISFPIKISNEADNINNGNFPKSVNVSYFIDFAEKNPAEPSKNIVLNINEDKKVKVIEKKNDQIEENHEEKKNEDNIKEKKGGEPNVEEVQQEENAMKNSKKNEEEASIPPKNVYKQNREVASPLPPVLIEKEKENEKGFSEEVTEDIYVLGIKDDMTEEDLIKTFSFYGDVMDCKIFLDKFTQKKKGSGIIKFNEKQSAFKAINSSEEVVCKGHPLKLRYSRKNKYCFERDETKREEKKFMGRIRERAKEKEDEELHYTQKW